MKAFISFTSTLGAYMRGELSLEDLKDGDLLVFSCTRDHVLEEGKIPHEVRWFNKEKPRYSDEEFQHNLSPALIDDGVLEKWGKYREIIVAKDSEMAVMWKGKLVDKYGTPIFYNTEKKERLEEMGLEVWMGGR